MLTRLTSENMHFESYKAPRNPLTTCSTDCCSVLGMMRSVG